MRQLMVYNRTQLMAMFKHWPDMVITVREHWQPQLQGTTRKPKAIRNNGRRGIQGNGYYFDGLNHQGKPCEMWADIPKASELRFNEDGSITFHPDTEKPWTLEFWVPVQGDQQ